MNTGPWREKRCHWQAYIQHKESFVVSTSHIVDNVNEETAKGSVSQALRNRAYNTLKGVKQFSRSNIKNVDNTINCSTGNILSICTLKNKKLLSFSSQMNKVPFHYSVMFAKVAHNGHVT